MRSKIITLALSCAALASCASSPVDGKRDYRATAADRSVKSLVERIAQSNGHAVQWLADPQMTADPVLASAPQALNDAAGLNEPRTMAEALERIVRLNNSLAAVAGVPKDQQLQVCVFPNAVVAKPLGEPCA